HPAMSGKACHCEEGLPEWIMSYADMITILMAFFVVMYSMAGQKDVKKEQAVMNSLRLWLGGVQAPWPDLHSTGTASSKGHGGGPRDGRSKMPAVARGLSAGGDALYFDATEPGLSPALKKQLRKTAEGLAGKRHLIEIRGVAGNRPLPAGSPYHDAVDLTFARCRQTRDYLASLGIEPERMQLVLASTSDPAVSADDPQLLNHDARVDIMLMGRFVSGANHDRPAASGHQQPVKAE
ncbi:MAG TPA: flagellar motor protein MotB, partial [Pirellulales bacterium]|nr:flagellar motor protein MotB [Pirellulales bacterium]